MKVTVYNVETGKAMQVEGVDAREYVKSGGWTMNPEEIGANEVADANQAASKPVDEAEVDAEVKAKTKKK